MVLKRRCYFIFNRFKPSCSLLNKLHELLHSMDPLQAPLWKRILAAVFYGFSSIFIISVNKIILTNYRFPSYQVLGLGQMVATIVILYVSKFCGHSKFPDLSWQTVTQVMPLPLIYMGNLLSGLGGTKNLSLPMFTVLRRFSIFFTMVGEYVLLEKRPSSLVQVSVYVMLMGAVVAASDDLGFDFTGYAMVLANDLFTAANGVVTKQKQNSKELGGDEGLLFYNSLCMIIPSVILCLVYGEFSRAYAYEGWADTFFLVQFTLGCIMGLILNYSTLICTRLNSPLTTTVIGCLKNLIVTYIGMIFIGGDYVFSAVNFIGLNISVLGSIIYSIVTFHRPSSVDPSATVRKVNGV